MKDIAKQRDIDGTYAYMGMRMTTAMIFNIDATSEATKYITDTYLECIDNMKLEDFLMDCEVFNLHNLEDLKAFGNLENIADVIPKIYGAEAFVDAKSGVLYTTEKESTEILENRKKLNYIGIIQEAERLATLYETGIVKMADAEVSLEIFAEYGLDIEKTYDIKEDTTEKTVVNILDRLNEIFSLW